jgi:hypothetical protein
VRAIVFGEGTADSRRLLRQRADRH